MKYSVLYGSHNIEFDLEYSSRKTLEISVHPDLEVIVKAPNNKELDEVLQKVKKRAAWIVKQKNYFSSFKPQITERKYISGETHRYLGKQYRLKLINSQDDKVKLTRGYLNVFTSNKTDREKTRRLLEDWYISHAQVKFHERLNFCFKKMEKYGLNSLPKFIIRRMTKRWGSCTNDGRLILNLDLIKAPSHCIDYVIMHELCHLKYHNHSPEFFNLLFQIMPDWETRKERLEKIVFS
ncbi:MAG TPA: M48 family peptidase [Cyanobacteria bacterium UBA9579]|nr:M48 family peptidase [Cyanobacteria bacterium UBA9579]